MSLREKLLSLFNRDIEYIDEYVQTMEEEIDDETKTVIAVAVSALASEDKDANFRIKSIKRVR